MVAATFQKYSAKMRHLRERQQQSQNKPLLSVQTIVLVLVAAGMLFQSFQQPYNFESVDIAVRHKAKAQSNSKGNENDETALRRREQQQRQSKSFTNTSNIPQRPVLFADKSTIDVNDYFSASWMQPREMFLKMKVDDILTVESACFVAINQFRNKVMMTKDWFQFSVEHMSKWWKIVLKDTHMDSDPKAVEQRVIDLMKGYLTDNVSWDPPPTTFRKTICVIAFQPYRGQPELTKISLAATIGSLYKAGFGRVVVVSYKNSPADFDIAAQAFTELQKQYRAYHGHKFDSFKDPLTPLGHMELNHVTVTNEDYVKTKFIKINVPKGALKGLHDALSGKIRQPAQSEWLGDHPKDYWDYVYLTEPDIVLQMKYSALDGLEKALKEGMMLAPHRLQPVPHELNFEGLVTANPEQRIVPKEQFTDVMSMDTDQEDVCCDIGRSIPGLPPTIEKCNDFWWICGFRRGGLTPEERHQRLMPYGFFRLTKGTGIISVAATEHGRQCIRKSGPDATCDDPAKK